jgi:hypothetical protein
LRVLYNAASILPITSFTDSNGQSVLPAGFGKSYSLYLTIDGTAVNNPDNIQLVDHYTSLNVTLWADPNSNDGKPSVDFDNFPSFKHSQTNDIALATGTMVSGTMFLDPSGNGDRHAILVESLNPTLDGAVLLGGSIKPGDQLQEFTTAPPSAFGVDQQTNGGVIATITDGTVQITLSTPNPPDPSNPTPDTILLPNIPHESIVADVLRFLHHAKG